jgi:hypothetical protein
MNASRTVTAKGGSAVPLRVDHVTDNPSDPTSTLYCTDIEGMELRVAVRGPPIPGLSRGTGRWYRFDGVVRSKSLGAHLLFPSENGSVERIETPERQTQPPLAERNAPWLVQLGATEHRIALTVYPRPTDGAGCINAEDPETFEIGAVCFEHCDRPGDTTVYHREEPERRDEQLLLEHVVEDLSATRGPTLVTRGSDRSPIELLYRRLTKVSGGDIVAAGSERVLSGCFHATPESVAVRTGADTLAEAAGRLDIESDPVRLSDYDIGIDPVDWREGWETDSMPVSDVSDPRLTDRDYTALVERYLGTDNGSADSAELARCLKAYASADLGLLRDLTTHGAMDRLGCLRLSGHLLER